MNVVVVSVIVVSFNSKKNLKRTLKSILEQDYPNIECIIVDGQSTDGSVYLIENFCKEFCKDQISKTRTCKWISEKDDGIYNALNKGLGMATGDIIGCLWDVYATNHSLGRLVRNMVDSGSDGVHGDLLYVSERGRVIRKWRTGMGTIYDGWMPGHPTLYLRKEIYDRFGFYDTRLSSASDYEFMCRIFKDNSVKLAYCSDIVVKMFYGGYSTGSVKAYIRSIIQSYRALRINHYRFAGIITIKRIIRTTRQFIC